MSHSNPKQHHTVLSINTGSSWNGRQSSQTFQQSIQLKSVFNFRISNIESIIVYNIFRCCCCCCCVRAFHQIVLLNNHFHMKHSRSRSRFSISTYARVCVSPKIHIKINLICAKCISKMTGSESTFGSLCFMHRHIARAKINRHLNESKIRDSHSTMQD